MSKQNDGGPAFPHWNQIGESGTPFPAGGGMALRDWFAGQAMTGLLSDPDATLDGIPDLAFRVADYMLAHRRGEVVRAIRAYSSIPDGLIVVARTKEESEWVLRERCLEISLDSALEAVAKGRPVKLVAALAKAKGEETE